MLQRWIRWRVMRNLITMRNRSIKVMRRLEAREPVQMDQIQKLVYEITLKLIADPTSELRSNSIDYTYQIENDNYLIIIRSTSNLYSINLIEYKTRQLINNFDVPFDVDPIKVILEKFQREIHKRMKSKLLMKTTRVAKHLQVILNDIEEKQKTY
jgi:hypothetical protein